MKERETGGVNKQNAPTSTRLIFSIADALFMGSTSSRCVNRASIPAISNTMKASPTTREMS